MTAGRVRRWKAEPDQGAYIANAVQASRTAYKQTEPDTVTTRSPANTLDPTVELKCPGDATNAPGLDRNRWRVPMKNDHTLDVTRLREVLDYSPETGVFRWKTQRSRNSAGDIAGWVHADGYQLVKIDNVAYAAHRIAWLHVHGAASLFEIDHRNGNRADNRIANLREATRSENSQNRVSANAGSKVPLLGVSMKQGRYEASIKINHKTRYIGRFRTAEEAHAAYLTVKSEVHPFPVERTV